MHMVAAGSSSSSTAPSSIEDMPSPSLPSTGACAQTAPPNIAQAAKIEIILIRISPD
jgi:hypothetical protein